MATSRQPAGGQQGGGLPVAAVAGSQVQPGQTIKDQGRWFTIDRFCEEQPHLSHGVRLAEVALADGGKDYRAILDEVTYPLREPGKPAAVIIQWHDWDTSKDVVYPVRYLKREYGGWLVVRADNSRQLGWVVKTGGKYWSAHVTPAAFCGASTGDTGDILDRVPVHLFNGEDQLTCRSIGYDSRRDAAAALIIRWLHGKCAPALGFGRHHLVERWENRNRHRSEP